MKNPKLEALVTAVDPVFTTTNTLVEVANGLDALAGYLESLIETNPENEELKHAKVHATSMASMVRGTIDIQVHSNEEAVGVLADYPDFEINLH